MTTVAELLAAGRLEPVPPDRLAARLRLSRADQHLRTAARLIPSYSLAMRTAISVPDETFKRASRRARDLGVSRSEFFSRAAARYLDELDAESVTHQIDLTVAALAAQDHSAADAVVIGRRVLAVASGNW